MGRFEVYHRWQVLRENTGRRTNLRMPMADYPRGLEQSWCFVTSASNSSVPHRVAIASAGANRCASHACTGTQVTAEGQSPGERLRSSCPS
jgi:hypothetical protein